MHTTFDIKSYSNLDMNIINNILSYCPISVQAKINKQMYNKIAPVAINKIIKAIRFHRDRMNMMMEYELPVSDAFIKAHYILHYPDEHKLDYCIRAINNMSRMENDIAAFMAVLNINDGFNQKKLFKRMIMQMSGVTIFLNGW